MDSGPATLSPSWVILALAGIGALLSGAVLGWANATHRDSGGYFSTSTDRFVTATHAITSDRLDLNSGAGPSDWFIKNDNIATVRIRAKTSSDVFIGIARQADVDRYLAGVAHEEVTKVNYRPFSASYRLSPGTVAPTAPATETFWVAKANGEGTQTLAWTPASGTWAVVEMNSNASPAVSADVALAVRVSFLGWLIGALTIGGVISLLVGAAFIIAGAARSQRATSIRTLGALPANPYQRPVELSGHEVHRATPVHLEGHLGEPLNRWLWLREVDPADTSA